MCQTCASGYSEIKRGKHGKIHPPTQILSEAVKRKDCVAEPVADRAAVTVSPDLNEQSSSLVSPQ